MPTHTAAPTHADLDLQTGLRSSLTGVRLEAPSPQGEKLRAMLETLGADLRAEEYRLGGIIEELVRFAAVAQTPSDIQLVNTVLTLSATEWQALTTEYPERSFRADLNRTMRRAVGLVAGLQEESHLYNSRTTDELNRGRMQRFTYLAYAADQMLPELEKLEAQARSRGLAAKAEHIGKVRTRLARYCEEVAAADISRVS